MFCRAQLTTGADASITGMP